MMIAARNAFLMSGAKLPYDAEIEYLESTGTQWIDTGVRPNGQTDFLVDTQFRSLIGGGNRFGCRDVSSGRPAFGLITHSSESALSISIARLSASIWNDLIPADTQRHVYSFLGGFAYFDGANAGSNSGSAQLSNTAYIFKFNNAGVATGDVGQRVFGVKFWQSGALVRDLIPVRVGSGSSAVGYLYDRANPTGGPLGNGLYGNAADGQGGVTGFAQFGADK